MTAAFEALKLRFVERCVGDLAVLRQVLCAPDAVSHGELKTLVHQMAGAAAVFGFPQLGASAMCLDDELSAGTPPSRRYVQDLVDQLGCL